MASRIDVHGNKMVRVVGEDASEQKVIDDIAKYGWHCVNLMADGNSPPFSFTVGLFHTYGHPEFVIFGLRPEVAHQVLNIAVEAVQAGRPVDLTEPTDDLLEGYPCCFVRVPESEYYEHLGFGRWYYQGNAFPAYQIVYPSRDGHFPWHLETTESFRAFQPALGVPRKST